MYSLNKNKSIAEFDMSWRQSLNIGDPYKEGFLAAGDLSRKRDKSKELSYDFHAGAPKDSKWESTVKGSQSIRTMKHSNTLLMLENMKECPQDTIKPLDKSPAHIGAGIGNNERKKKKVELRKSYEVLKEPKTYFKSLQSNVSLISEKIKAIKSNYHKKDPFPQSLTKTPSSLSNLYSEYDHKQRETTPVRLSLATTNLIGGKSQKKEEQKEKQIVYLPKIK